jgi:hypothetical protein
MRLSRIWITAFVLTAVFCGLAAPAGAGQPMSVQVRTGHVRAAPTFLARIVAEVSYGERLEVLAQQTAWCRVAVPGSGRQGWIHISALSAKPIVLRQGAAGDHGATRDELALAGKGFNRQVETAFRARNPQMDFTWVDRMEGITVTPRQSEVFLQQGQVVPRGGRHD